MHGGMAVGSGLRHCLHSITNSYQYLFRSVNVGRTYPYYYFGDAGAGAEEGVTQS